MAKFKDTKVCPHCCAIFLCDVCPVCEVSKRLADETVRHRTNEASIYDERDDLKEKLAEARQRAIYWRVPDLVEERDKLKARVAELTQNREDQVRRKQVGAEESKKRIEELKAELHEAKDAHAACHDALKREQSAFKMYRNAWIRELGGLVIPKGHDIDSLVLTTREQHTKAKEWNLFKVALERLSRLGNGDIPGNSIGNKIAQTALDIAKGKTNG